MPQTIEKQLTPNDCGETGAHQAGICVPKGIIKLAFFPRLDPNEFNPRTTVSMLDDAGVPWAFEFIYYNSRLLGRGTRNEYRLTWMTRYFRAFNLKASDTVIFRKEDDQSFKVGFLRFGQVAAVSKDPLPERSVRLRLASGWKVIDGEW